MLEAKTVLLSMALLSLISTFMFYNAGQSALKVNQSREQDELSTLFSGLRTPQVFEASRGESNEKFMPKITPKELKDPSDSRSSTSGQKSEEDTATLERNSKSNKINLLESFTNETNPFRLLGAYSPDIGKPYVTPTYDQLDYGLINDDDYCNKADFYNLAHPEGMFEEMNLFVDYATNAEEMVRKHYVSKYANDLSRNISTIMNTENYKARKYEIDPRVNHYFTKRADLHHFHKLGQHFGCASQMYNHIPGNQYIWRKDLIVDSLNTYLKKFENRPQCFGKDVIFPSAYRFYHTSECKRFFKMINSEEYKASLEKEPMQYVIKVGYGAHKAKGVFLLDANQTESLNAEYEYGARCGVANKNLIAQKYIANPLLLNFNNKFDFRIYMLVASTNPLIVYYYDGFLRVSVTPYDKFSTERNVHLTNTFINKEKFDEAKNENKTINGMTEKELRDYHIWNFDRLQSYLLESGKITDPNWLNNYLRPAFKRAFIHLVRMGGSHFWNQSNVYEFFGLDFMLDEDFNLWFIECNASPQFIQTNDRDLNRLVVMLSDIFEIQYSYYRSRMKRVLEVIKNFKREWENSGSVSTLVKWKAEYKNAVKNQLEPEYKISEANLFNLIMDENLPGAEAYFGHVPPECVAY